MNSKFFNLALMCLWLSLCVGVLTRESWMSDEMREKIDRWNPPLVIGVAALLAVWNFVRFFVAYQFGNPTKPSKEVEEYRRKIRTITGTDPKVTDPQFDFDGDLPDAPPRGSHS